MESVSPRLGATAISELLDVPNDSTWMASAACSEAFFAGYFLAKFLSLFQEHSLPTRRCPCLKVELQGHAAKVDSIVLVQSRLLSRIQNVFLADQGL